MKGDPEFVILKPAAWLDAGKFEDAILGAVVRNPLAPSDDYVSNTPLRYNEVDLIERSLTDFLLASSSASSTEASAALRSVAGVSFKANTEASLELAGKLVRYKRLQQHGNFWSKLRADPAVLGTVPDWISLFNTWPPCLVVGIMTAEEVDIDYSGATEKNINGKLEAPLATVGLAAAGAPAGLLGGVDAGDAYADAGSGRRVAKVFRAKSGRSSVFALELRVVTTKLLQKRQLQLKDGGPKVDAGRLAGVGDDEDSDEEDKSPEADDLILGNFNDQEYLEMVG